MNIKIITGFLLGSLLASTHIGTAEECNDPKEENICMASQSPLGINGCLKIDAVTTKNKDCTGSSGRKECLSGVLVLGATKTVYRMINQAGFTAGKKDLAKDCTCGTHVVVKSAPVEIPCRDAMAGSDCDSTGTGK